MRSAARLSLLLATAVALALPAVAAADIKPILKPEEPKVTPAKAPTKAPAKTPARASTVIAQQTQTPIDRPAQTSTKTPVDTSTKRPSKKPVKPVVVASAEGGRDQSGVAPVIATPVEPTLPAAATPSASVPAQPDPTPLALVGTSEPTPSRGPATPPWKLSLLALLAASEAFLVVRLVRNRPLRKLSPAR